MFIDSVLVLLSETSERIGGSGVFDFASGDFAFREKNLWNIVTYRISVDFHIFHIYIFFDTYIKYISRREVRFNSKTYGASSISLLSLLGNINIISIYPEKRNIIEIELY